MNTHTNDQTLFDRLTLFQDILADAIHLLLFGRPLHDTLG